MVSGAPPRTKEILCVRVPSLAGRRGRHEKQFVIARPEDVDSPLDSTSGRSLASTATLSTRSPIRGRSEGARWVS
jgi:hypothetical protein